jgi:hypothetical protein
MCVCVWRFQQNASFLSWCYLQHRRYGDQARGCTPSDSRFAYWQEQEILLFSETSKTGPMVHPVSCIIGFLGFSLEGQSSGGMTLTSHSQSSAKVNNDLCDTFTTPNAFMMWSGKRLLCIKCLLYTNICTNNRCKFILKLLWHVLVLIHLLQGVYSCVS